MTRAMPACSVRGADDSTDISEFCNEGRPAHNVEPVRVCANPL
jgi:hypothetical protein